MRTDAPDQAEAWAESSEKQRREEALHWKVGELEEFAYMAAHDLQEPLRAVTSYLSLLEARYGGVLEPQAREWLELALDGGRRMQDLVDGAITAACGQAGPYAREWTDPAEAVRGALANLRVALAGSPVQVRVGHLPMVLASPDPLKRLFQNLIGNALRHGAGATQVSVDGEERPADWIFRVADDGPGFSARPIPGLGLQICARIAARHGGRLWIPEEKGAAICFTLSKCELG